MASPSSLGFLHHRDVSGEALVAVGPAGGEVVAPGSMVQAQAWRSQWARMPAGTGISTVISWPGPAEAAANPASQRVGRWTALAGREA